MLRKFIYFFLFFISSGTYASSPNPDLVYCDQVSGDSCKESVFVLTSDSLFGRETGKPGQKKAAAFIFEKFQDYGLRALPGKTDFILHHALSLRINGELNMDLHQRMYLYLEDYFYQEGFRDTTIFLDSLVFAGYGISNSDYDDYKGVDVQGKAILIYEGVPGRKIKKNKGASDVSGPTMDWRRKLQIIKEKKPGIVFVISSNLQQLADSVLHNKEKGETSSGTTCEIPIVFITEEMALGFFPEHEQYLLFKEKRKIDRKGAPSSFSVKTDAMIPISSEISGLTGENIAGMIEGSENNEEYILITAHYDHLGKKDSYYFPGADDNASGTAAVLELARVFARVNRETVLFKRSLVFMLVSGEEEGLLGSSYFVRYPPIPLKNIVANLNIDMIGRTDPLHDSLGIRDYIYVIGPSVLSDELQQINASSNQKGPKLLLDYRYNSPMDPNQYYYRSDQFQFAKNKIPVIFYFSGEHADYHKTTDTADKLDFSLLRKRAQLVFLSAWELATRKERPGLK